MDHTALDQGVANAIVGGYFGAPFDVLGPHLIEDDLVIRSFQPDADNVNVVFSNGQRVDMSRVHDAGLFEVCLLYTSPSPRDRTRSRMPSSA